MVRSKNKDKRTRSGSQPKKKSKPTIFICPYTEQNVYIERATLADLKSKSTYHAGGKKKLWILSSSQLRHELYADAAQAIASREQALLPSFGGRSWEVTCSMREENNNTLFRSWKGKMELAVLPHVMDKIPDPPRWPGRKSQQLDEYFENDDDQDIVNLQSREVSTLSSVAWDLKHLYPVPAVNTKWLSPCHKMFTSRKMAWDHATELAKREILIDKHILGIGATGKLLQPTIPSAPMALKVGKLRFERDGLWVVNQELSWQESRQLVVEAEQVEDEASKEVAYKDKSKKKRKPAGNIEGPGKQEIETDRKQINSSSYETATKATPLSSYVVAKKHRHSKEKGNDLGGAKITSTQAETELRKLWKTLSEEEQEHWKGRLYSSLASTNYSERACGEEIKQAEGDEHACSREKSESSTGNFATEIRVPHISATSQYLATFKSLSPPKMTAETMLPVPPRGVESVGGNDETAAIVSLAPVLHRIDEANHMTALQAAQDSNEENNASVSIEFNNAETNEGSMGPVDTTNDDRNQNNKTPLTVKKSTQRSQGRQRSSRRKHPTEKAMYRWCLNHEQMELCYTACMSHYEDVMRTVKARDLARELADGFDVLRERGRGRFDMELPVFETEAFSFLTDLQKAPWMPIVKCILGEDVALIHKGCFLSLPDAETQVYHQDGVHLNKQSQKPCHAINVFVPLVDLTARNGPTEFCLGSHILGNEGFDKDFAETPKPKAGTPIIFDYRLGHRGLGNSSSKCRPIVYCTYARGAADGKEFRDSVNFSRRRYHKIGELTQKPLSREERRLKRKRSIESRKVEAEAKKIAVLEQQETFVKGKENKVEMQNVDKSTVVSTSQNFDFPTDNNEWQTNMAIEISHSSREDETGGSSHLPSPETTGGNQSD